MLIFLLSISDEDDRDKINLIFKRFHNDMLRVARHKLRELPDCSSSAEDAVENAFLKITKYIKSIKGEGDSLRAYIITVTVNECINILNGERSPLSIEDYFSDDSFNEDSLIDSLDLSDSYDKAVNAIMLLNDRYRIPLYMRYVEELTVEEISERTATPVKTVYTRLTRGLQLVREYLERRNGTK